MKQKIRLNTHDIQKLMICVIYSGDTTVATENDKERYLSILTELNNRCNRENDYTLTVMVDDGKG